MSKASEWAKTRPENMPLTKNKFAARVGTDGMVEMIHGTLPAPGYLTMEPEDALKLARWILDTFGEQP